MENRCAEYDLWEPVRARGIRRSRESDKNGYRFRNIRLNEVRTSRSRLAKCEWLSNLVLIFHLHLPHLRFCPFISLYSFIEILSHHLSQISDASTPNLNLSKRPSLEIQSEGENNQYRCNGECANADYEGDKSRFWEGVVVVMAMVSIVHLPGVDA